MADNIVEEWLGSLNLAQHAQAFIDNGYDDLEICKQIGTEDLDAIGVVEAGERAMLLQAVEVLQMQGGACVYFTLDECTPECTQESTSEYTSEYTPECTMEDSYTLGKRALSWAPVLKVAAIHERLVRDEINLTDPSVLLSEDLTLKLEGLAKKYAIELEMGFGEVLAHLKEICKTPRTDYARDEDYENKDYADIESVSAPSQDDEPVDPERWRHLQEEEKAGKSKDGGTGMLITLGHFFRNVGLPCASRRCPFPKYEGDLTASEITMSEEERVQLLLQVKEKRITMQDALQRVKFYEDERRPSLPENLNSDIARLRESLPVKSNSSSSLIAKLTAYRKKSKSEESRSSSSECSPRHQLSVIGDINISNPQAVETSADYAELEDVATAAAKLQGLDSRVRPHQSHSCTNSPQRTRKFVKTSKSSDEPLSQLGQAPSGSTDDKKSFLFSLRKKLSIDISQTDSSQQGSSEFDSEKDSGKDTKAKSKEKGKVKKEKTKSTKDKTKESKASEKAAKEKGKSVKDKAKNKAKDKIKEKSCTFPKDRKSGLLEFKQSTASASSSHQGPQKSRNPSKLVRSNEASRSSAVVEKRQSSGSRIPAPSGRRTNGESDSQSETERCSRVPKPLKPQDSSSVRKSRYASKLEGTSDQKDSSNQKSKIRQRRSLSKEGNKSSGDESSRSSTGSRLPVKAGDTPPRSPTYRILPKIRTERADSSGSVSSLNSQSSLSSYNRNLLRSSSRSPGPRFASPSRSPSRSPARSPSASPSLSPTKRHSSPLLQSSKKQFTEFSSYADDNCRSPRPGDGLDTNLAPNKSFLFGNGDSTNILRSHGTQSTQRSPKAFSSVEAFSRKKGMMFVGECETMTPNSRHSLSDRIKVMKDRVKTKLRRNKTTSVADILDGCDEDEDESQTSAEKDASLQPAFSPVSTSSSPSSMSVEEEDSVHKGPFVGRARVIRSYTPSPYDREALTLTAGDIINITSKHESGIWRGVVNNKEGTFKFINVEVLPEEKPQPKRKTRIFSRHSTRQHSKRRPKPRTVAELMQRLGLEDLTGIFMFNGFESLEHFSELEEDDLNELCINNPEQRAKILTAAQMIRDYEGEADSDVSMSPALARSISARSQENTVCNININQLTNNTVHSVVRDSGCYPSMEGLSHGDWNHSEMVVAKGPEITCKSSTQSSTQTVISQQPGSPKSILKHRDTTLVSSKGLEVTSEGTQSLPGSPSRGRPQGPRVAQITGALVAKRSLSPQNRKVASVSANVSPVGTPNPTPKVHHASTSALTIECRRVPWQPPPSSGAFKPSTPERSSSLTNNSVPAVANSGKTVTQVTVEVPWPLQKDYASSGLGIDNINIRTMSSPNICVKNTPPGSPARTIQITAIRTKPELSASLETLISKKLQSEDIDLTALPYTDKCGFCGIPVALVQRYSEEMQRELEEVAAAMDECRVKQLKNAKKLAVPNDFLGEAAKRAIQDTISTASLQDFLLSVGLPMYIDSLYSHNVRSLEAMLNMGDCDFQNCGVGDGRHRERLLKARDLLRAKMPSLARPTVTRKLSEVRDKV